MIAIPEVKDVDIAFGGGHQFMPTMKEIPVNIKIDVKWENLFNKWFFEGVKDVHFFPKKGVDLNKALRAIASVIGSYAPSHQHKEAAVTYWMSEWFEDWKEKI